MSDFDVKGLDKFTENMYQKIAKEYPKKAENLMKKSVGRCKAEAIARTKKGPTGNLKKRWKHSIKVGKNSVTGSIKNTAPHAYLRENGHFSKNGGWVEGDHMLGNTMTRQQPKIDADIEKLVDETLNI